MSADREGVFAGAGLIRFTQQCVTCSSIPYREGVPAGAGLIRWRLLLAPDEAPEQVLSPTPVRYAIPTRWECLHGGVAMCTPLPAGYVIRIVVCSYREGAGM